MQEKNENKTKIIERLSQYVDCQGENFNKLSEKIEVSNSYFSKMLKNKANIGEDILRKILLYYEKLNPDWLILGIGNMERISFKPNIASKCYSCQEKNERIKELKETIAILKDHIALMKEVKNEDAADASVADVG